MHNVGRLINAIINDFDSMTMVNKIFIEMSELVLWMDVPAHSFFSISRYWGDIEILLKTAISH